MRLFCMRIAVVVVGIFGFLIGSSGLVVSDMDTEVQQLHQLLTTQLGGKPGQISVAFTDLVTGRTVCYNEGIRFNPASVIKIPVMVTAFTQVQNGKKQFTDKLTLRSSDRIWGSGDLYYAKAGSQYTLIQLVEVMITHSDNTATKMLIDYLGIDTVNATIRDLGLSDTVVSTTNLLNADGLNYSTPYDMNRLLYKLAKSEIATPEMCRDMIDILSRNAHRWGIPKHLPASVRVANKTGTLTGIRNDSGIIFLQDSPYILSVFTKMTSSQIAQSAVVDISDQIYRWRIDNLSATPFRTN